MGLVTELAIIDDALCVSVTRNVVSIQANIQTRSNCCWVDGSYVSGLNIDRTKKRTYCDIDGIPRTSEGTASMDFEIGNYIFRTEVHVGYKLKYRLILGFPFLQQYNCELCFRDFIMTVHKLPDTVQPHEPLVDRNIAE